MVKQARDGPTVGPMTHARVVVTRFGGPEVLEVIKETPPEPKVGEVRLRVLAAGVAVPDLLVREGAHPEARRPPFTPGWDLVGVVDRLGEGVVGVGPASVMAGLPVHGAHAAYVCLPVRDLVPVPPGLDPAEAVGLVLNYVTAFQMLHRVARVRPGDRVLVHGAAGAVGTALLQLARRAGTVTFGTCGARAAEAVRALGAVPIDHRREDVVAAVRRRTGGGVDVVLDGIGGGHAWRSLGAVRRGGMVVAYGLTASLHDGRLAKGCRHRFRGLPVIAGAVAASHLLPGGRRVVLYSVQALKRIRPSWFRQDLELLFELLRRREIVPRVAHRLPLAEVRRAHELLGRGGLDGKVVLVGDGEATDAATSWSGAPFGPPASG